VLSYDEIHEAEIHDDLITILDRVVAAEHHDDEECI